MKLTYFARSWVAVCSVFLGSNLSPAGVIRDDRDPQSYLNLAAQPAYASVGRFDITRLEPGFSGTGTLIDHQWVLTAAHLLEGTRSMQFNVAGRAYDAAGWVSYSKWKGDLRKGYDIALVKLAEPVDSVAPAARYAGRSEMGLTTTLVGFGRTGTGDIGADQYDALERAGTNVIDGTIGKRERTYKQKLTSSARIFVTDFDNPHNPAENVTGAAEPTDMEFLISLGDSGGPAFVDSPAGPQIAGITSFGEFVDGEDDSDYGDIAGFVRVSKFNKWIDKTLRRDVAGKRISGFELAGATAMEWSPAAAASLPEPGCALGLFAISLLLRRSRR